MSRSAPHSLELAVVLVHASPGDRTQWKCVARALEQHAEVVAIDLPDYGSAADTESLDPDDSLAALRSVVASLSGRRVVLAGVSYGAYLVARLLEAPPEPVVGAVLLSGFARLTEAQAADYRGLADALSSGALPIEDFARLGADLFLGPAPAAEELHRDVQRWLASLPKPRLARALRRAASCARPDRQVRRLALPVTLLHGRNDLGLPPAFAEELASLGPSRLEVLDTSSHLLCLTHPDHSVRAILELHAPGRRAGGVGLS
jgi:pimeloyl-ACP methyl ester carboxylesterase